jgi:putative nucleotidyltransferase with HDIG domain
VLGLETVKALVLARRFLAEHRHLNSCYLSLDKIWEHSIHVAQIARDLVLFETKNRALAAQALAAGLLHDLGKIVLASNFDDLYGRVHSLARKQPVALWEIEREMFGASHGEIGACLVGMWNMPIEIVDAAAFHHEPPLCEHDQLSPLAAVHIANVLEHQRQPNNEFRVLPAVSTPFLNQLRLLQRLPIWRATFAKAAAPAGSAEGDEAAPVAPVQEAAPSRSPAGQETVTVTATQSAEPAPLVEATVTATPTAHPHSRGLVYFGLGFALMLLLAVAVQRGSNSSEPAHIQARTLSAPEALVLAPPTPQMETAPESPTEVTPRAVELPPEPETVVASVAEAEVWPPVPEVTPTPAPEEVVADSVPVSLPSPAPGQTEEAGAPLEVAPLEVESTKPSEPEQPAFKLNGIFYSSTDPAAIVNGKSVRAGEKVGEATVVRINRGAVTLDINGERKTLSLPAVR